MIFSPKGFFFNYCVTLNSHFSSLSSVPSLPEGVAHECTGTHTTFILFHINQHNAFAHCINSGWRGQQINPTCLHVFGAHPTWSKDKLHVCNSVYFGDILSDRLDVLTEQNSFIVEDKEMGEEKDFRIIFGMYVCVRVCMYILSVISQGGSVMGSFLWVLHSFCMVLYMKGKCFLNSTPHLIYRRVSIIRPVNWRLLFHIHRH